MSIVPETLCDIYHFCSFFILENQSFLPEEKVQPLLVPSTNVHYRFETSEALKGIIEQEFGFRESFPVAVAERCRELVFNNGLQTRSMLWIGAGVGRGPMLMSKTFEQVKSWVPFPYRNVNNLGFAIACTAYFPTQYIKHLYRFFTTFW